MGNEPGSTRAEYERRTEARIDALSDALSTTRVDWDLVEVKEGEEERFRKSAGAELKGILAGAAREQAAAKHGSNPRGAS